MIGRVALVKTDDRAHGVRRALDLLGARPTQGKHVFLKPNYNSADPAPGSTHPDVLRSLTEWLYATGAESITVGDRSGMGDTRQVMRRTGAFELAEELGLETVVFDELDADGWVPYEAEHWSRGFAIARPVAEAESVVQACCLKTHRFGGHFTLSLKNSVGIAAKQVPGQGYNYMSELHNSADQRVMIAEINSAYSPDLVVLDGVEAFTTGGPEAGMTWQALTASLLTQSAWRYCATTGRPMRSAPARSSSRSRSPGPSSLAWACLDRRASSSLPTIQKARLTPRRWNQY
jgi:uncharacterized protein (DUF362 family)